MQVVKGLMLAAVAAGVFVGAASAAEDDATKARIAELENKRAELHEKMRAVGGNRSRGGEGAAAVRAVYAEIQDVTARIIQLRLGPEDGAKYAEYHRKSREVSEQRREVWADKDLDADAKKAQMAELNKRWVALYKEHSGIIKKASKATQEAQNADHRQSRLEALKKLLKPREDEWKVLEPRLAEVVKVQDAQRREAWALRTHAAYSPSYLWKRPNTSPKGELVKTVKKEGATTADIQARIDAFRKDRDEKVKALAALDKKIEAARKSLREILTVKQEAVLVVEGVLD